jgi:hypothetical protein
MAPQISHDKYRQIVPEVWFRIVHLSSDYTEGCADLRKQKVEIALGSEHAFEGGNIGVLTRLIPAERVISAVPEPRYPSRPPQPPRPPQCPVVAETIQKALEWRRQIETGQVARQVDIADREGVSPARVTQVLMLLRLAPQIQQAILTLKPPTVNEQKLRPIALIDDPKMQIALFEKACGVNP